MMITNQLSLATKTPKLYRYLLSTSQRNNKSLSQRLHFKIGVSFASISARFSQRYNNQHKPFIISHQSFSTLTMLTQKMTSGPQSPSSDKDKQQQQQQQQPYHDKDGASHSTSQTQPHANAEAHDEHSHSHSHHDSDSHGHEHGHSHSHGGASSLLHHHHHSAHEPNEFLAAGAASIKSNAAVRITWIGLVVNVALAISKGIGGVVFHSQALVADAIHSVSDMLADFLTLATVNVAAKVGTPTKFPFGYGKIETIGSFTVSAILLFAGISVGWSSLLQIFEFVLPTQLYEIAASIHIGHSHNHTDIVGSGGGAATANTPSHGHGHTTHTATGTELATPTHREIPNINAAWLAAGSIVAKEILYKKTMQIATETNSKVLVANAWHHRVDSLTAIVALLTVAGGVLFNIAWLDSIGGMGVSALIIKAGWDTLKEAWYELIDRGEQPGSALYDKVESIVTHELQSRAELHQFKLKQLSVLSSGANTNINFVLLTENKSIDLSTLNRYERTLTDLIKQDDRFVRNISIKFEVADGEEAHKDDAKENLHGREDK
ncbi:MMT2 [Candida theae]|uniref:MMT2 n=1 Tax=Candida theae TaxID=1198502 RepID=A0AAD5BCU5_9ASCO|nr:MMT2 [Candida theae]KAI5954815.1 MMT2 [Candida theae]